MAVDDVWILTVKGLSVAGLAQSSLAFLRTLAAEPTPAEFTTLAAAYKDIYRANQNSNFAWATWKARQIRGAGVTWPTGADCTPIGGLLYEAAISGPLAGGLSGDMLPAQCAMVVTLRTAVVGRRFRGRVYTSGWGEVSQFSGTWDTSHTAAVNTAWTNFISLYGVAAPVSGFRLGIWSTRTASGCEQDPATGEHHRVEAGRPADAFTPVISHTVRPNVHTQRRRALGVGV